jgi:hypothetical protein
MLGGEYQGSNDVNFTAGLTDAFLVRVWSHSFLM